MARHPDWIEGGRVTAAMGRVTAWLARMVHDEAVRWAFGVFLTVRVCLSALAIVVIVLRPLPEGAHERYVMSLGLEPVQSRAGQLLIEVWQRWDVVHYERIAAYGYTDDESTAFYPLFPALVRLVGGILLQDYLLSGILVSNVAFVMALTGLYKLTEGRFGAQVARRTTLYISVFPTAFFFLVPYPEALLLLLVVLAFYASQKGKWVLAFVAAGLASCTRMTGALLVLPLGYEYLAQTLLRSRRLTWHALLLPLTVLPAAAFLCFRQSAGYLPPSDLVNQHWRLVVGPPWQDFANLFQLVVSREITSKQVLDAAIAIPFLFVIIAGFRWMPVSYQLYVAGTLLLLFVIVDPVQPLVDLPRHVLVLFPGFMTMGILGENRLVHRIITYCSTALLILLAGMFVRWYWVS